MLWAAVRRPCRQLLPRALPSTWTTAECVSKRWVATGCARWAVVGSTRAMAASGSGDSDELAVALEQVRELQAQLAVAMDTVALAADGATDGIASPDDAAEAPRSHRAAGSLNWLREAMEAGIARERQMFEDTAEERKRGDGDDNPGQRLKLRVATVEDMAEVHAMVYQLAVFEKEPEAVVTTPATFERDGFGLDAKFVCAIGEVDGEAVCFALVHPLYSTWTGTAIHLEDLFVRPEWRRQGIGERMIRAVAGAAYHAGCRRVQWVVLDWNVKAISVYKRIGATHTEGWLPYRLDASGIRKVIGLAPEGGDGGDDASNE